VVQEGEALRTVVVRSARTLAVREPTMLALAHRQMTGSGTLLPTVYDGHLGHGGGSVMWLMQLARGLSGSGRVLYRPLVEEDPQVSITAPSQSLQNSC
jgi:hypothetical protein